MISKTGSEHVERKARLTRLRARLKYGLGAYHLLANPARSDLLAIDGVALPEFRAWVDATINGLRGSQYPEHFILMALASAATERNRTVVFPGTPMERVIYEPSVWLYQEHHGLPVADAIRVMNQAVDAAVRVAIDGPPDPEPDDAAVCKECYAVYVSTTRRPPHGR
jgi:hypothetical protein